MWVSTKGGKPSACCLATQHSFDAPPKVIECAYQTPLRPITEYAIPAWNPHTTKGVATVESVQRRAEIHKCVLLIKKLNWSSLQEQRTSTDLSVQFYKIQYNLVALPFPSELSLNTSCTRKSHSMTFNLLPSFVDAYKYLSLSFFNFNRCIPVWNSLPSTTVTTPSLPLFKSTAKTYLSSPTVELADHPMPRLQVAMLFGN